MKKIVVLLLVVIIASTSLFAAKDSWVGVSAMFSGDPILLGYGGGVNISTYNFLGKQTRTTATASSSEERSYSGSSIFSDYTSLVPAVASSRTSRNSGSSVQRETNGKKIGFMGQAGYTGASVNAFSYPVEAFVQYYSFGLALRQFIGNTVTMYEGIAVGAAFGSGSYREDTSSGYSTYDYDLSAYGLTFDFGAKWDFSRLFSLLCGMNTSLLFGGISSSYYYSSSSFAMMLTFQPYLGVTFNY